MFTAHSTIKPFFVTFICWAKDHLAGPLVPSPWVLDPGWMCRPHKYFEGGKLANYVEMGQKIEQKNNFQILNQTDLLYYNDYKGKSLNTFVESYCEQNLIVPAPSY